MAASSRTTRTHTRSRRLTLARRPGPAVAALAAAAALAGCDGGPAATGPEAGLTADEAGGIAAALSEQSDEAVTSGMDGASASVTSASARASGASADADERTVRMTFARTRECPRGGTVTVEGEVEGTYEPGTRTLTARIAAVKTHDACGVRVRDRRVRLTGRPNLQLDAERRRVAGRLEGLQTATLEGAVAWRAEDGREGVCEVALEIVVDPEARTRTVAGTLCGHQVERTRSRRS